jgi:hypothetical protein
MEEYIAKCTIRSPIFKNVIKEIVQLRSRVQAISHLFFTQYILLVCNEKKIIPH